MQHKDIPDSERHELKGASTALVGSVPVANGAGGTSFQKLGATSLAGSIPTSIANLPVATDGAGGFTVLSAPAYGTFQLSGSASDVPNPTPPSLPLARFAISSNLSPVSGMSCSAGVLTVNTSGIYQLSVGSYAYTPPTESTEAEFLNYHYRVVNLTNGSSVLGASNVPQIVSLTVSTPYVVLINEGASSLPAILTVTRVSV